jgi:two-component system cell cycle response regulator
MKSPLGRRHEPVRARLSVLIVDDDPEFQTYLAALVRKLGFRPAIASDGIEALAKARTCKFDLLIADYRMPRMNGLELIEAIRAETSMDSLYAVMLSGHETADMKLQALTLGYDDFLAKDGAEIEIVAKVAAARRMLTRQLAVGAAAEEWRDLALNDELTNVSTRRFFFERAAHYLRSGRTIGIVLFDLDDFKSINDTHGHLSGDQMLSCVGALFLKEIRADDVIARFGGDEFVLLALDVALDETRAMSDRLATGIRALQCKSRSVMLQVGVSTGVASSAANPYATLEQLLETADQDLYAAKAAKNTPSRFLAIVRSYAARGSKGTAFRKTISTVRSSVTTTRSDRGRRRWQ